MPRLRGLIMNHGLACNKPCPLHLRYGMWIDPSGQYMAWYIDDTVVFELSSTGLTNKTNPNNVTQTVGERLIPKEPMYIALGMQSDAIGSVALPDYMEVDWVRLWQRSGTDSMGCDPTDYPTSTFISSRTSTFGTLVCGDGICQAGECSQCPADCLEQEGCKQNCNVTQCQVRDTDFVDPSTYWTYTVCSARDRSLEYRNTTQPIVFRPSSVHLRRTSTQPLSFFSSTMVISSPDLQISQE